MPRRAEELIIRDLLLDLKAVFPGTVGYLTIDDTQLVKVPTKYLTKSIIKLFHVLGVENFRSDEVGMEIIYPFKMEVRFFKYNRKL